MFGDISKSCNSLILQLMLLWFKMWRAFSFNGDRAKAYAERTGFKLSKIHPFFDGGATSVGFLAINNGYSRSSQSRWLFNTAKRTQPMSTFDSDDPCLSLLVENCQFCSQFHPKVPTRVVYPMLKLQICFSRPAHVWHRLWQIRPPWWIFLRRDKKVVIHHILFVMQKAVRQKSTYKMVGFCY